MNGIMKQSNCRIKDCNGTHYAAEVENVALGVGHQCEIAHSSADIKCDVSGVSHAKNGSDKLSGKKFKTGMVREPGLDLRHGAFILGCGRRCIKDVITR